MCVIHVRACAGYVRDTCGIHAMYHCRRYVARVVSKAKKTDKTAFDLKFSDGATVCFYFAKHAKAKKDLEHRYLLNSQVLLLG